MKLDGLKILRPASAMLLSGLPQSVKTTSLLTQTVVCARMETKATRLNATTGTVLIPHLAHVNAHQRVMLNVKSLRNLTSGHALAYRCKLIANHAVKALCKTPGIALATITTSLMMPSADGSTSLLILANAKAQKMEKLQM